MQKAIDTFKLNIDSVKQLDTIFLFLEQNNIRTLDITEILRSQLVLAVSAMDNYISDVILIGLMKIFENNLPFSNSFAKFQIDMSTLNQILNEPDNGIKTLILGRYIQKFNEKNSYQKPENIVNSLKLIGISDLWNQLSPLMSIPNPDDIKRELENIVTQRNKIAHEADFDSLTQTKRLRDRDSTKKAVEFIESFCYNLQKIIIQYI